MSAKQNVPAHGAHHHSDSFIKKIFHFFRWLYQDYYTAALEWFGNKLGGRAHAGRNGQISRGLRLSANTIAVATIIAVIILVGVSTFWTGGLALPLWATGLLLFAMVLNWVGLAIGSASNHQKIGQYYDADEELKALINEERAKLGKDPLPHHSPFRKKFMIFIRYSHDANGMLGTLSSWAATILEAITWLSAGLIIFAPIIGSALFVASRASAVLSATGAMGTNQHRLWVYKKNLKELSQKFYDLCKENKPDKHDFIEKVITSTFKDLGINPKEKYSSWVHFRCYKAIHTVLGDGGIRQTNEAMKNILVATLKPFIKEKKPSLWERFKSALRKISLIPKYKFDRRALKNIQGEGNDKLAVLDSMSFLECQIYDDIYKQTPGNNSTNFEEASRIVNEFAGRFVNSNSTENRLFLNHLKRKLLARSDLDLKDITAETLHNTVHSNFNFLFEVDLKLSKIKLHKKNIADCYPLLENPHGNQYLNEYHASKLADAVVAKINKRDMSVNNIPDAYTREGDAYLPTYAREGDAYLPTYAAEPPPEYGEEEEVVYVIEQKNRSRRSSINSKRS